MAAVACFFLRELHLERFGLLNHCIMRALNLFFCALFRNYVMSRIGKTMVVGGYINMLWLLCMGYCFIATLR